MSQVDPFAVDIPEVFLKDPQTAEYFRYLHTFLQSLWERSGGAGDGIEQIVDVITGNPDAVLPAGSSGTPTDPADTNPYSFWNGLIS